MSKLITNITVMNESRAKMLYIELTDAYMVIKNNLERECFKAIISNCHSVFDGGSVERFCLWDLPFVIKFSRKIDLYNNRVITETDYIIIIWLTGVPISSRYPVPQAKIDIIDFSKILRRYR